MARTVERLTLAAFVAEAVLAGGNAVAVRYSNRELEPFWGATLRFALAALLLAVLVVALRIPVPRGRAFAGAALYGALTFGVAFACAYYALDYLHAGVGQTFLALVPLTTLLVAVAARQERITARGLVGTVLAVAGIAVISDATRDASVPGKALAAVVLGVFAFGAAGVVVRGFPKSHPLATNAVASAAGALVLLVVMLVAGESPALPRRAATWWALAYVVPVGSIVVFGLYIYVLRTWTASRAAYGFVITPIVTVLISHWLDDEPITRSLLIGGVLVLLGVYVGALRPAADAEVSP